MTTHRNIWLEHLERMARPVLTAMAAGKLHHELPRECTADCDHGREISL